MKKILFLALFLLAMPAVLPGDGGQRSEAFYHGIVRAANLRQGKLRRAYNLARARVERFDSQVDQGDDTRAEELERLKASVQRRKDRYELACQSIGITNVTDIVFDGLYVPQPLDGGSDEEQPEDRFVDPDGGFGDPKNPPVTFKPFFQVKWAADSVFPDPGAIVPVGGAAGAAASSSDSDGDQDGCCPWRRSKKD